MTLPALNRFPAWGKAEKGGEKSFPPAQGVAEIGADFRYNLVFQAPHISGALSLAPRPGMGTGLGNHRARFLELLQKLHF